MTSCLLSCSLALVGCGSGSSTATQFEGNDVSSQPPPPSAGPDGQAAGPLFEGTVVRARSAAPVVGGTLLATRDGKTLVAADPERDSVFLVDTASHRVTSISLSAGDEPGRVVEGPEGTLFVALRRGGGLVAIDVASATVVRRAAVCAAPRGVAYDAKSASVYLACRSGSLFTLAASDLSVKRAVQLDTDLRDVIVRDRDLVVTRFLSAEVLLVGEDGQVSRRATPATEPGCGEATVAFRALALPGGQVALAHQVSSNDVVQEESGGYGFSCGGSLVARVVSVVDVDTAQDQTVPQLMPSQFAPGMPAGSAPASAMTFRSVLLPAAGPLDVAFDAKGTRIAAIALDESLPSSGRLTTSQFAADHADATLWLQAWSSSAPADFSDPASAQAIKVNGQPVAVAFDAAGKYVVQSREPATLELEGGASITLSTDSHADTGHRMFHMDSGIGISCSSCHPEGGEDGHVWHFPEGLRRTLPLEGGVMERAPFHWDGTLGSMSALVSEVMVKRMSMQAVPSALQVAALGSFLEQLPELAPAEGLFGAAVSRGRAIFQRADVACATCHNGPQYTDNRLVDVGTGGKFVTPSLLGVGLRQALFHDGCARNLAERFGVCGGTSHGKPELLSADEQADLITFLRSL